MQRIKEQHHTLHEHLETFITQHSVDVAHIQATIAKLANILSYTKSEHKKNKIANDIITILQSEEHADHQQKIQAIDALLDDHSLQYRDEAVVQDLANNAPLSETEKTIYDLLQA